MVVYIFRARVKTVAEDPRLHRLHHDGGLRFGDFPEDGNRAGLLHEVQRGWDGSRIEVFFGDFQPRYFIWEFEDVPLSLLHRSYEFLD